MNHITGTPREQLIIFPDAVVAQQAQRMLHTEELTVCADAGYYDCVDLKSCEDHRITTYVPTPGHQVSKKSMFRHQRIILTNLPQ
ncbi:MAG: hypothetical protein WCX28_02160 [Bacteriovoracaceae bacterium]